MVYEALSRVLWYLLPCNVAICPIDALANLLNSFLPCLQLDTLEVTLITQSVATCFDLLLGVPHNSRVLLHPGKLCLFL